MSLRHLKMYHINAENSCLTQYLFGNYYIFSGFLYSIYFKI